MLGGVWIHRDRQLKECAKESERSQASIRAPIMKIKPAMLSLLLFALHPAAIPAATLPSGFSEALVASGISAPTAMAFAPDGRLFVCQQDGALRVIKNDTLLATPFVTLTTDPAGERGLLGVAFDPNFAS